MAYIKVHTDRCPRLRILSSHPPSTILNLVHYIYVESQNEESCALSIVDMLGLGVRRSNLSRHVVTNGTESVLSPRRRPKLLCDSVWASKVRAVCVKTGWVASECL